MTDYPGIFRARCVSVAGDRITAYVPQVFGDLRIVITSRTGAAPPAGSNGWVMFESALAHLPVWVSESGGIAKQETAATPAAVWTDLAPMLFPAMGNRLVHVEGRLYSVGGMGPIDPALPIGDGNLQANKMQVYDIGSNTWSLDPDIPVPSFGGGCALLGSTIYMMGGALSIDSSVSYDTAMAYDTVAKTYTTLTPIPTARAGAQCFPYQGKVYVFGGSTNDGGGSSVALTTLEVYDPVTNTWDGSKASAPVGVVFSSGGMIGTEFYAVGPIITGSESFFGPMQLQKYNPETDVWTLLSSSSTPTAFPVVGVINGKVYAVGGFTLFPYLVNQTVQMYDPTTAIWIQKPQVPFQTSFTEMAEADGYGYIAGGINGFVAGTDGNFSIGVTGAMHRYSPE